MSKDIITLYGSGSCHKTKFYRKKLASLEVPYHFSDVTSDLTAANEVRLHYDGKLHFPVFVINKKWIRNPSEKELNKYLNLNLQVQE